MRVQASFTAFADGRVLASGTIEEIAFAVDQRGSPQPVLIFDDITGSPVDLDFRQGPVHAAAEFQTRSLSPTPPVRQGRGRPKLGVVAREVTLLPRHWDWLATQPGGASAALRRLIEAARRGDSGQEAQRMRREAAYRVMSALAGDLPDFEEASRALFAGDSDRLRRQAGMWPPEVLDYVLRVLASD